MVTIKHRLTTLHKERNCGIINAAMVDILESDEFILAATTKITDGELMSRLPAFKMTIVPNTNDRGGDGGEVVMHHRKFINLMNDTDDLLEQFIHDAMHEIVWELWKHCPVQVAHLTEMEHDVFDEILMQAHIFKVMPSVHSLHCKYVNNFVKLMGYIPGNIVGITTLYESPSPIIPHNNALNLAHRWIYKQDDVLNQDTFNQFMMMCFQSLKDGHSRKVISDYQLALNGKL